MKLVKETDPILLKRCEPFDFNEPIMDPYEISDELQKIRKERTKRKRSNLTEEEKIGSQEYHQSIRNVIFSLYMCFQHV